MTMVRPRHATKGLRVRHCDVTFASGELTAQRAGATSTATRVRRPTPCAAGFLAPLASNNIRPVTLYTLMVDRARSAMILDRWETTVDVEQSGGVAPGANIAVYTAPNTNQGFVDLFAYAIDHNLRCYSFPVARTSPSRSLTSACGAGTGWPQALVVVACLLAVMRAARGQRIVRRFASLCESSRDGHACSAELR